MNKIELEANLLQLLQEQDNAVCKLNAAKSRLWNLCYEWRREAGLAILDLIPKMSWKCDWTGGGYSLISTSEIPEELIDLLYFDPDENKDILDEVPTVIHEPQFKELLKDRLYIKYGPTILREEDEDQRCSIYREPCEADGW